MPDSPFGPQADDEATGAPHHGLVDGKDQGLFVQIEVSQYGLFDSRLQHDIGEVDVAHHGRGAL